MLNMLSLRNKMIPKELLENPYFTLSQLALLTKNKKNALVYISRWLKNNLITKIRDGFYISSSKFLEFSLEGKISSFIEYIATNLMYIPSYLSLEYVLYENSIITENVYNITCITTKKTAKFENNFGNFSYRSIKKDFFGDYEIVKKDGFIIYKATKEKALFDYFYLKSDIIFDLDYFKELRLNLKNINLTKFEKLTKKYKSEKMIKVFNLLKDLKG
ncbi:MAG: hypothetical protein PHE25_06050 [Candidatus Gracilibacteria bacterium]|nr:hypothetical protein [Candidatus Gracilibacteria bacterium]